MIVKIMMIDDHLAILMGYKSLLLLVKGHYEFEITMVTNCEEAFHIITNPDNTDAFDLVFLDYSIPAYPEKNIENGQDLGVLIREYMPKTKIVVLTSHSDSIRLFTVVNKIHPEGIVIKSDFDPEDLIVIVDKIVEGEFFYSPLALKSINEPLLISGKLDEIDRQIIMFKSQGFKIESIADKLFITSDTIKKRKSKIKELLNLGKCGDEELLKMCRALNLLPN